MVLIGCLIIIGTLVGAAVLWVKLGDLERDFQAESEDTVER
jgi:hypothetical protein